MRRVISLLVLSAAVMSLPACAKSSRGSAREQFVQQLADEGGLSKELAQCIADKFFVTRSDQELKEFFARKELTADESEEFQRLGKACLDEVGSTVPSTG